MKLITKELTSKLPALYANENIPVKDQIVIAKFFCPWSSYTFYITEGNRAGADFIFYGYVTGLGSDEWGYTALSELCSISKFGLGIERDIYWKPTKVSDIPYIKLYKEESSE